MNHANRANRSNKAHIALGANLPFAGHAPAQTLRLALDALPGMGIQVHAVSQIWTSPAWPNPDDPVFVNAVAQISARRSPFSLLRALHTLERRFGRQRHARNAPRTLDLDIISYGSLALRQRRLELPHPRMAGRAFVLLPLQQTSPRWHHPVNGKSLTALIACLPQSDRLATRPLNEARAGN